MVVECQGVLIWACCIRFAMHES